MSDRDKPIYNPESSGDLDDYWASSASFQKHLADREASIGPITNKTEWFRVFAKAIADAADDDDFILVKLREKTDAWEGSAVERQMMLNLLDEVGNLFTHW